MVWLFNLAAYLPLAVLHRLGVLLGWAAYRLSGEYAGRLRENFGRAAPVLFSTEEGGDGVGRSEAPSGQKFRSVLNASIEEAGKAVAELPWVWRRPLAEVTASIKACYGWELVDAARLSGKGVIILTPHMGCFDILALYIAEKIPITALYRPPKLAFLEPLMRSGRERGQLRLARTDVGGVRMLYKALKRGEAIGLLPDQVPGKGEGEWANFFGRPAYTMTLVGRLAQSSGAAILMSHAERLPDGAGYAIHFTPLQLVPGLPVPSQINAALEQVIRSCPAQYLWSYNRYKIPAGALEPGHGEN